MRCKTRQNILSKCNSYMEKKDWQGIIEDAKNKYDLEWPQD